MINKTLSTHLTNVVTVFAFLLPVEGHLTWYLLPILYKKICSEDQEALLVGYIPLSYGIQPMAGPTPERQDGAHSQN